MKKATFLALALLISGLFMTNARAQTAFSGAKPILKKYNALYVINTADEKHISGTLRNMNNALNDPRLKGKIHLELVAFGDGVAVFKKDGPFQERLKSLQQQGVDLGQCENTLRERKIEKNTLFDFIGYVPSGNGEIILRSAEGWAIVHP